MKLPQFSDSFRCAAPPWSSVPTFYNYLGALHPSANVQTKKMLRVYSLRVFFIAFYPTVAATRLLFVEMSVWFSTRISPPRGFALRSLRSLRAKIFSFGSIGEIRDQKKHVRRKVFLKILNCAQLKPYLWILTLVVRHILSSM